MTNNYLNILQEIKTLGKTSFDLGKIKSEELKQKIDLKIQERAVLSLKSKLAEKHKSFDDYNDEELEIMLSEEKRKIQDNLKNMTLTAVLTLLGLNFLA